MTAASQQVFASTPNWNQLSENFKKAVDRLRKNYNHQRALNSLSELNDSNLRDIGLTRNDLDQTAGSAEIQFLVAMKRERICNW